VSAREPDWSSVTRAQTKVGYAVIELDDIDDVAVVRLTHGKVNALDLELVQAITQTFHKLEDDPVRAVVLTGSGRTFCAGVDLSRIVDGGGPYVAEFLPALVEGFVAIFRFGKPVVAAVNGHAIAGGAILVSACDYRIMSGGRIGVTELRVGVPFPVAAMEILQFALGGTKARAAIIDGETYDPTHAAQLGLIDAVANDADLLERAIANARTLANTIPADTYRHTKQQLHRNADERIERWTAHGDAEAIRLWTKAAVDGRIARFMTEVVGRGR
jgi:enoyl-CoA hydratase